MAKLKDKKKDGAGNPNEKRKEIKFEPIVPGQKTVYSFHPECFEYTGTCIAYESELEPGVFHLPANSTEIEPPKAKDKKIRVFKNGAWSYEQDPQFVPEVPLTEEQVADKARRERSFLLSMSDWTQLPDSPLTADQKNAYMKYREDLRNVTKQKDFPNKIKWPQEPK